MKVKELMKKYPVAVSADDTLGLAGELMLWAGIRHLPVLRAGRLVGVLSERDLAVHQAEVGARTARTDKVETIMVRSPQTASPEDSITEVAGRMALSKISCLPVVERGDLVGMLTTTDILASQVETAMHPPPKTEGPKVKDVMTAGPESVHPDDPILDAAGRMHNLHIRHLPVIAGDGALLGILSDRDIRAAIGDPVKALDASGVRPDVAMMRVRDAMTPEVVTVAPDELCTSVARYFIRLGASAVPVVDESGKLVGILSYIDLLRGLTEA